MNKEFVNEINEVLKKHNVGFQGNVKLTNKFNELKVVNEISYIVPGAQSKVIKDKSGKFLVNIR